MAVIFGRESYFNKGRYQLTNGNILKWGVKSVHPPISSKKTFSKITTKNPSKSKGRILRYTLKLLKLKLKLLIVYLRDVKTRKKMFNIPNKHINKPAIVQTSVFFNF